MRFLKTISFIILLLNILNAKDIIPTFTYKASGSVTDIVLKNEKLYVATSSSKVDIFNIRTQEKIKSITIPQIKDFMGDVIDSKIYSVDVLEDMLLILSQGTKGGRAIHIYKNEELKEIISAKKRMFIARAKFIDKKRIVFSLLSNQLYLYNLEDNKKIHETQISQSKFSNFVLSEDKKQIVIADESGILQMLDVSTQKVLEVFKEQNLDNVFQVDLKNDIILTAGQDRRAAVFSIKEKSAYHKNATFLIYSAGLSPSGKIAGIASNEDNEVSIFNTKTKEDLHLLKGNKTTLTNIVFINEKEVFVSSDDERINYYKIN
jgi:WD40 repeat protein